ncbi:MAG TPA: hypothetical protein VN962_07125, partial [Polyangia bacterium]|nr:hypothetical protein [Polyangia bacterium]
MEKPRPGRVGRWLKMIAAFVAASTLLVVILAWISTDHFRAFGGAPAGARLDRMRGSARFAGGKFQNVEPTALMGAAAMPGAFRHWLFGKEMRVPAYPLPLVTDAAARLATPAASGLR